MWVDTGELVFSTYDAPSAECGDGPFTLCRQGCCETLEAGKRTYIDDKSGIHAIANGSKKPAISVHLYAGPIGKCRIYDETTKTFSWKTLEYHTVPGRTIEVLGSSAALTTRLH
jgi:hypothetical protein